MLRRLVEVRRTSFLHTLNKGLEFGKWKIPKQDRETAVTEQGFKKDSLGRKVRETKESRREKMDMPFSVSRRQFSCKTNQG